MSFDGVTLLFVPANRPERFSKAAASGADAIIIDLEDAVSPDARKSAREALLRPGALPAFTSIFVRINSSQTQWYRDDVAAVASLGLAGVVLPKAESADEVQELSSALPQVPLIAMIESARGLVAARSIAAVKTVVRLAFGSWDFCADIRASHSPDALLLARSEIILASRINNLELPIDGVSTGIDDAARIEEDARYAQKLGFGGKLCIHPNQISPVQRGFAPSESELSWARRILAAQGDGTVSVDGMMVDAPVRARARQIVARLGASKVNGV